MLIQATDKLNKIRRLVIPGKISEAEWRQLQTGEQVDVLDDVGAFLVNNNYATEIEKELDNG